jgi:hypothetical protein
LWKTDTGYLGVSTKGPEINIENCFLELPLLPAYITMKGPYVRSEVGAGVITACEFDQSKFLEQTNLSSPLYKIRLPD